MHLAINIDRFGHIELVQNLGVDGMFFQIPCIPTDPV